MSEPKFLGLRDSGYYTREYLDSLVSYLQRKAPLVKAGLDAFSPADTFTYNVLCANEYIAPPGAEQ